MVKKTGLKAERAVGRGSVRHASAKLKLERAKKTAEGPRDVAPDAFVDGRWPRRGAKPTTTLDAQALAQHVSKQEWFGEADKPIAKVEVLHERDVETADKTARYTLATLDVKHDDGTHHKYLAPLRVDGNGAVTSALDHDAFKQAMVAAVERGEHFDVAAEAKAGARRRPSVGTRGATGAKIASATKSKQSTDVLWGGAFNAKTEASAIARAIYDGEHNHWSALVDHGYTTRERFEYVREQATKLSPKSADALVVEFFRHVYQTLEKQPPEVKAFYEAVSQRPKFSPVFYGYAQFMAVPEENKGDKIPQGDFDDLVKALDVIQGKAGPLGSMVRGLGFNQIELLPFYLSPQKDGGYDITKHEEVAPEVGGNEAHARFMNAAVERGIAVTADLVANHVAGDHPWVKALLQGDESMLSRFVVWDDAVKLGERVVDDKTFNVFLHTKGEHAGKISHVWQIFPDNNPDTFIDVEVNGKKHKIFASFMNPFQWDVNAEDPNVLAYFLSTMGHFANLGQLGTRMDAIIHAGKKPGTFNIDNSESQAFMALAKAFTSHVAPGNIFLPEANLPWEDARGGWLEPERAFDGKIENTAGDVLISFDVHRAIWDSLLKGSRAAWHDVQASLGELPPHKSLLVYLGLHDETLIEDPALRKTLIDAGFHDFAGRGVGDAPIELLGKDPDRLAMAHVLLYSSKGHPAVYYRTVVGSENNKEFYDAKTQERLDAQGENKDAKKARDSRDLDRGGVLIEDYERALKEGYKPAVTIQALNALWDKHGAVRSNDVTPIDEGGDAQVVSFARRSRDNDDPPLLQLVNLSGSKKTVSYPLHALAEQLGWSGVNGLVDLLDSEIKGKARDVAFRIEDGALVLDLAPYEAVYLEQRDG